MDPIKTYPYHSFDCRSRKPLGIGEILKSSTSTFSWWHFLEPFPTKTKTREANLQTRPGMPADGSHPWVLHGGVFGDGGLGGGWDGWTNRSSSSHSEDELLQI